MDTQKYHPQYWVSDIYFQQSGIEIKVFELDTMETIILLIQDHDSITQILPFLQQRDIELVDFLRKLAA